MRYLAFLLIAFPAFPATQAPTVDEIVRRSVANTNTDWNAAPRYDYTERDVVMEHGKRIVKTWQVMMIEGSTYNKLVAIDGRALPAEQAAAEDRKLQQEIEKRRGESASAHQQRVAQYQKERRQDHALLMEMVKAFTFQLAGEDTVNGRRCFVLDATPKADYRPPSRDTQVLRGMRGKMWVDAGQYQWVKVHAEVFRPVSFGLFIARVRPGTEFTLEEKPVQGNLWLPSHFTMRVNARILVLPHNSSDDETYSDYHIAAAQAGANRSSPAPAQQSR